jgi:hypothetical protein
LGFSIGKKYYPFTKFRKNIENGKWVNDVLQNIKFVKGCLRCVSASQLKRGLLFRKDFKMFA